MPPKKYDAIYLRLRHDIESEKYPYGSKLPSEHTLVGIFGCSRNTVRRAVGALAEEGYVQPIRGKGVLVIYHPREQAHFSIGGIESMKEAAERNQVALTTQVRDFREATIDAALAKATDFPEGTEVFALTRVRFLDGEPLILDYNFFRRDVLRGLTAEIAEGSIYEYLEKTLGETVVTTRRRYTVERATEDDAREMDLRGYNCMMVVSNKTFNKDGVMFEYTTSRHRPDHFVFYESAQRRPS